MAFLKIVEGPGAGEQITLGERATLGRFRTCDLKVRAPESSRVHAEIFLRDAVYYVKDLGSSNGTFVNDERTGEQALRNGDRIRIGPVVIEYGEEEAVAAKLEPAQAPDKVDVEPPQVERVEDAELVPRPLSPGGKIDVAKVLEQLSDQVEEPQPKEAQAILVAAEAPAAKEPPPQFPGYAVLRRLRGDELSTTYLATELALDRPVAIELIRAASGSDPAEVLSRVRRAAQLEHPAVAHVHTAVCQEGAVLVVREPAPGRSMWELCGRLPAVECAKFTAEAADALAEAHAAGVIHGSIRPDRILRTERGHVKLVGLGLPLPKIGSLSDEPDLQKRPNRIAYMPPEQLAGAAPTEAADIYSLGASLYHMVCGRMPFAAVSEAQLAPRIATEAVIPVLDLKPETPRRLAEVIEKMLSRSPGDRPRAMADVAGQLRNAGEEQKPVRASGASLRLVPQARPRGIPASTIIIVILTLLLLVSVFLLGRFAGIWFIQQGTGTTAPGRLMSSGLVGDELPQDARAARPYAYFFSSSRLARARVTTCS